MKKHLKFVLFLGAIALIAYLILDLKKEERYDKVEAVKKLATKEFLGIKVFDIFLGVLAVAFVGITAGYVASLVKGSGKRAAASEAAGVLGEGGLPQAGTAAVPIVVEEPPKKKLALEKVLGRTGAKIVSVLLVIVLILIVLAIVCLLFPDKLPFLQKLFEKLVPGSIF